MDSISLPPYITHLHSKEIEDVNTSPFLNHPEILLINDLLNRYERDPIRLTLSSSEKINLAFLNSLALNREFFYFYLNGSPSSDDFNAFKTEIKKLNTPIVFIAREEAARSLMDKDSRWILIADENDTESAFTTIVLDEPKEEDLLKLLKAETKSLEHYHKVTISDELIYSAFTLAKHYLSITRTFDKALALLDTASVKATTVLTQDKLIETVSQWTKIPASYIQNNQFEAYTFKTALQQTIFGQDNAIAEISGLLQQAYIGLYEKTGPLCSFLLVGATETGKTLLAQTIAEYLFGHDQALFQVDLKKPLADLIKAVREKPYLIILLDDLTVDEIQSFELLKDIFTLADFSHAIFIITTRIGSECIKNEINPNDESELLHLVFNKNIPNIPQQDRGELTEKIQATVETLLPTFLLSKMHIVPMNFLDIPALEKLVRERMDALVSRVLNRFEIELTYSPEVIKFLARECFYRKPNMSLEKILENHLYSAVAHEMLSQNQPKRLLLNLTENGHLLKCSSEDPVRGVFKT